MKILHVIASIDPAKGGPQSVVMRLATAQSALGHEISVASYADPEQQARAVRALAGAPRLENVGLHLLRRSGPWEGLTADRAARIVAPLVDKADFVHLHGVWEPVLLRAAIIARRHGIPYCVLPHGMLDPWSLTQRRWKKSLALALAHRRMINGAAFVHVLNADEQRLMEPLGLRPPRVTIPNGVFLEEIAAEAHPGRFRPTLPALGSGPFVLFLSRLHSKKGLDLLAQAFVRLARRRADVSLVVAGPDDGAEPEFRAAIAAAGLAERTHVIGPLYGALKYQAYADAACFCLPSRQEGFSVAITEALACGVPVAVSEACHFPEVAAVGAGLVLPLDPEAFAVGLERILADPTAAGRMGEKGRRLVAERFTWPRIARQTITAYANHGSGVLIGEAHAARSGQDFTLS